MFKKILFLSLLVCSLRADIQNIPKLVESVTAHNNKLKIVPNKAFRDAWLLEPYFFAEYDNDIDVSNLDDSILIIPFVAVCAPIIWATNSTYTIPVLDEEYYYALQKVKKVYQVFFPTLSWEGDIVPEKLVKNGTNKATEISGVLFSGGLDAVCTSFANLDKNQLLITICGGDVRPQQEHMWKNVQQQAISFAKIYSHSNAFIRSNFLTIFNQDLLNTITPEIPYWWGHTSQSISYTGLAAPLVVAKQCKELRIASTRTIEYPYAYGTHPVLDNCIAYAGIPVIHDGAELDRMGKVQLIERVVKEKNVEIPLLRVCWGKDEDGGNCCECEKCLRTMNELIVEGADPQAYGFEISLETLMQRTKKYFNKTLSMKAGLWWHWGCVLKRIKERLEEENSNHIILFDATLRTYILWLSRVNLDGFDCNRERLIVREQQRAVLTHLWQQSLAGISCF